MEKPILFTIVRAVPFVSGMAFWATKVENKGESAITTAPQNNRNTSRKAVEWNIKTKGENKQQHKEAERNSRAINFVS